MTTEAKAKPRIKRRDSALWGKMVWQCAGRGHLGMGETPERAYYDWLGWARAGGKL